MDLNNISLSSSMLNDFYRNVLVEAATDAEESLAKPTDNANYFLGNNQKKVLIISRYENAVHISDASLSFLTAILTACRLTIADTAICNMNTVKHIPPSGLLSELQPKTVILFGTGPEELDLPAKFPHFQKQTLNKITYLAAPRLEEIEADKDLKMKLWASLKNIFNV